MLKIFPTAIRVWLRMFGLTLCILWLGRILFMVAYPQFYRTLSSHELWQAWLIGFRFDFATALISITIPFLPFWFPLPKKWIPLIGKIAAILAILLTLTTASFLWGDGIYYAEAGHHATFEVQGLGNETLPMVWLLLSKYTFLSIGLILFWVFLAWLVWRIFRPLAGNNEIQTPQRWWGKILLPITIIFISVFGIRGGFQLKPMRMAFAFSSENILTGHLALNGWYTFVTTAFANHGKVIELMPDKIAFERTRQLLHSSNEKYLDEKYPLYRHSSALSPIAQPGEKLNVVLIIVESLTAEYLKGSFGGSVNTMPFLDSLASQSVRFNHFYSIGTRSMEGLSAVLMSIPNLMGTPFMGSTQEQTTVRGLGTIFREQGYTAKFIHGAKSGSMNIQQIATIAGYPIFYDEDDFPNSQSDGFWGVWDRYTLQRMSHEMDTLREPFHFGMFTLSTHNPFLLPPEFKPPFPKTTQREELYNTFANLDVELRKFFGYESKQPRFNHTIYVILGDHTSMIRTEEGVDTRFRIGCLMYAPGRLAPCVIEEPASQLDIEPTLIQLCGLQVNHSCFGHSLFDTTVTNHFAYFTQSGMVAWRDEKYLLVNDLEHDIGLFDPLHDSHTLKNIISMESNVADSMRFNLYSFYQTAERVLNGNRIVPLLTK